MGDVQIEPMKWGTCPKCQGNLDEANRLIIKYRLDKLVCQYCGAILWGMDQ